MLRLLFLTVEAIILKSLQRDFTCKLLKKENLSVETEPDDEFFPLPLVAVISSRAGVSLPHCLMETR